AVDKLSNALAHQFGKLRSKRAGAQPQMIDGAVAGRDALLEEDFLADELVRNS
ncbi:MAG TPA: ribosomal subunit interface protein, partial [Pseudomonas sp.]|nr:ribosomal subunit interface protein [Pseudomonas sp.]